MAPGAGGAARQVVLRYVLASSLPTVSIADGAAVEGNSGTSVAALTVTMSAPSATDVTMSFATSNGTATAGADYQPVASGFVLIPAGADQCAGAGHAHRRHQLRSRRDGDRHPVESARRDARRRHRRPDHPERRADHRRRRRLRDALQHAAERAGAWCPGQRQRHRPARTRRRARVDHAERLAHARRQRRRGLHAEPRFRRRRQLHLSRRHRRSAPATPSP